MKKRVLTLIASLIVVAGLLASQGSNAWFVTAVKRAQNITIGAVSYSTGDAVSLDTVEEDFYGRPRIYPGQNLIVVNGEESALTMFNSSTIDTKIRVKIEYTSYKDGKAQTVVYSGAEDEDLEVEFADNSQWKLFDNGMDGACFYYVGNGFEGDLTKADDAAAITPDIASVEMIRSVKYKDDIDASLYSGNEVTLNIIFEAKQADYVEWSAMGEYQVSDSVN